MSFAAPIWLAALALVPAAIVAARYARRRARRYAVRFPAVSTVALAIEPSDAWRRRVPAALALAALAALALTMARPHVSYSAPVNEASVMLVSDESGSMAASDVQPTRLAAAESAANTFIDQLPAPVRIGALAFSSAANAVQAPVAAHSQARNLINAQSANGGTATGDALAQALTLLHGGQRKHAPAAIVLLSDGDANQGQDPTTVARTAAQEKIPIYTVALGTPNGTLQNPADPFAPALAVPPDPQLMAKIAELSGGRSFNALSANELSSIYRSLGKKLGTVTRRREVTADFAVGALVLLLLAGVGSTRWSGRLP